MHTYIRHEAFKVNILKLSEFGFCWQPHKESLFSCLPTKTFFARSTLLLHWPSFFILVYFLENHIVGEILRG